MWTKKLNNGWIIIMNIRVICCANLQIKKTLNMFPLLFNHTLKKIRSSRWFKRLLFFLQLEKHRKSSQKKGRLSFSTRRSAVCTTRHGFVTTHALSLTNHSQSSQQNEVKRNPSGSAAGSCCGPRIEIHSWRMLRLGNVCVCVVGWEVLSSRNTRIFF